MAHTRGTSANWVRVDRQTGGYVSPAAAALRRADPMGSNEAMPGPPLPPPEPLPPITSYRMNDKTVAKDMTAYELFMLLRFALGENLTIEATPDEWQSLPADCRRHMIAVRNS